MGGHRVSGVKELSYKEREPSRVSNVAEIDMQRRETSKFGWGGGG